ncbi:MAG TPA: sugar phosphate isomerase/epimerase [Clostridia bacterium]|jgi:sugar phosphate isomerase/epimerase|nr:MAG: Xylose isomerase-like TIM barrel [Firmicutes bacterium ADurb.Bin146]HOD93077.1 sugar phosphate isomerase/epimerase [Clostridia bacterium]HQM39400.1 sugar phosphate isomerase/epimerase [Clostridia bacterium]
MDIGMVTRGFPNITPVECAGYLNKFGFKTTELCFMFSNINTWQYNGYKPMDELTDELAASIVKTFKDNSIEIVSIGAFSSLLEPDPIKLAKNFKAYERYIQIAANNGIKFVSTESGFIPGRRGINADTYEKDFDYFKSNMINLLDIAKRYNVSIAFEPCILDLTPSAKRTRDLILQCERDNLKILLDPANLFANSDEEDMFRYLKNYVAYFHGKDRKVNDAYGRNVGEGDIDWVKFLRLYKKYTPNTPFILEYCNLENCADIKQRVLDYEKLI